MLTRTIVRGARGLVAEVQAVIELLIDERRRDIGSFEVGRVLPFGMRRATSLAGFSSPSTKACT